MRAVDLVVKKRNGESLSREEIAFLVQGFTSGTVPDYQFSAFLMAVYFQGMTAQETGYLTQEMISSGQSYDLSSIAIPKVDKHSTGGVGDKTSLILAPIAAACGLCVPMMSGRSLGHTGGTLDKLESIAGYRTNLTYGEFITGLERIGFAMTGQSEVVVPADRKMYALRDVSGTVESVPLITASILSKKAAEGTDALVLDVKVGSGAFMKRREHARGLARALIGTGDRLGMRIHVVMTDMGVPLGRCIGNFLEVQEVIACLNDRGPDDLMEVTIRLAGRMLVLGGICSRIEEAEAECRKRISDGSAYEKFLANVEYQGGDTRMLTDTRLAPRAALVVPIESKTDGFVAGIDAYSLGISATTLGAGRSKQSDHVLPEVGIQLKRVQGDRVSAGDILCLIHGATESSVEAVRNTVEGSYTFSTKPVPLRSRIIEEMSIGHV